MKPSRNKPDGTWENVDVGIVTGLHGSRSLRAGLLEMAYTLIKNPTREALIVLNDSRITEERLAEEMQLAREALHPALEGRLNAILVKDGAIVKMPPGYGENFREWLEKLIAQERSSTGRPARSDSVSVVLELLVHQWLLGRGPMTTDWLVKTTGYSYPTVASALRRLEHCLHRHSDRRIELRYFPHDDWARLVANADEVRGTRRYTNQTGQGRSPEAVLKRLAALGRDDIAVGGVRGALHYCPDLDATGSTRVDLSLHATGKVDWSFVHQLDPALEPAKYDESAALVIHLVQRKEPLFQLEKKKLPWADPVECLLDLHEARLEPQALEFVNVLKSRYLHPRD